MHHSKENIPSLTQNGLVISYFGNSVAVEDDNGQVFQCHLRKNQELPVVGDKVTWQLEKDNTGLILQIQPRRSVLRRGDGHGRIKPIAANIDLIVIVMAPRPIFSPYLVDRYLVAAELLNIDAIIAINKSDLLHADLKKAAEEELSSYRRIGYPAVFSSALNPAGLKELYELLKNKNAVLVGPSGVGKSSIILGLGGGDAIRIGEVSLKGIGKHTTTATRLYHLPQGGNLIDSPGVREFNLWDIQREEVLKGFKEILNVKNTCKFRDCKHRAEPGCTIKEAVEKGEISQSRYENYCELMKKAETHKPTY